MSIEVELKLKIRDKAEITAALKQLGFTEEELVVEIDPNAFIIVQEAHQVLGDGFIRYSKDNL